MTRYHDMSLHELAALGTGHRLVPARIEADEDAFIPASLNRWADRQFRPRHELSWFEKLDAALGRFEINWFE